MVKLNWHKLAKVEFHANKVRCWWEITVFLCHLKKRSRYLDSFCFVSLTSIYRNRNNTSTSHHEVWVKLTQVFSLRSGWMPFKMKFLAKLWPRGNSGAQLTYEINLPDSGGHSEHSMPLALVITQGWLHDTKGANGSHSRNFNWSNKDRGTFILMMFPN